MYLASRIGCLLQLRNKFGYSSGKPSEKEYMFDCIVSTVGIKEA